MNFFSSALSSLTGTSIPYTFKEKIVDPKLDQYPDNTSIWTVYNGLNSKGDNAKVTIFEFNLKDPVNLSRDYVSLAKNAFRKAKLLKLPGIVLVVDFIEDENYLYIVTEPVVPLAVYLQESEGSIDADCKTFGIFEVGSTLLLVNQSSCLHGNVSINSVFVTQAGDWRLFGLELTTNLTSDPDQPVYRFSRLMPGYEILLPDEGLDGVRQFPLKLDSFKFGQFIYQVFNSNTTNGLSGVASMNNVPRQLAQYAKKLVAVKPLLRPTVEKFMKESSASVFSKNKLVLFNQELDELKFKNEWEKLEFFKHDLNDFTSSSLTFPPGFLEYKLLPELISQYQNIFKVKPTVSTTPEEVSQRQETISILLNSILNFGGSMDESLFSKTIKPIIFQAFTLPDRSIRLSLLSHLQQYSKFLTESDVQLKIFNQLLTGFQDTNFTIRETTLTSITMIIDKVSTKQVNQELLKVLAKSQMDPKPSIRTNTLVLIIKISLKIYNTSKNNVLITALSKSLRDSFVPCKLMALNGFESLIDEFSLTEICGKILGHLAISLMDEKSYKIRTEARRVFDLYLNSVEEHAKGLPRDDVDEEEEERQFFAKHAPTETLETAATTAVAPESDGFFSFGALKLSSAAPPKGSINNNFNVSTPDLTRVGTPTTEPILPKVPSAIVNDSSWDDDFDVEDSWGGPEEIVEEIDPPKKFSRPQPKKSSGLKLGSKATPKPKSTLKLDLKVEDDDDNWGGDW